MKSVGRSETGSPNHKSRLREASDGSAGRASVVVDRPLLPPRTAAAALDCIYRQVSVEREENGFRGKMLLR